MGCLPNELRDEMIKVAHEFEKNPKVKAFGYDDVSTGEWLWNKYVGNPRDPQKPVTQTDLNRYKLGLNEFTESIGKKENTFLKYFKLPKALMRKLPESTYFIEEMSNATSFRQKHLKESAVELNTMIDGLYDMVIKGDYYGGTKWSKKEFAKYQDLERDLEVAKTPEERMAAMEKITEVVGVPDSNGNPVGGQILRRFNDILTFKVQPKRGTVEETIRDSWNKLRKRSAASLLSGIEQAKALIKTNNDVSTRKDLLAALDKLQSAADRIHFQESIDAKTIAGFDKSGLFSLKEKDLMVFDSESNTVKPYKMINEHGERVFPRELTKYAPQYVIELANVVRQVTDFASKPGDAKWIGKDGKQMNSSEIKREIEEKVDLGSMINRLKARTDVENGKFSSLDPVYYLNKYVQDVAHFNYTTRINLAYKKAAQKMWEVSRRRGTHDELGNYAKHMGDMIGEIRDSALNNYEGSISEMDQVVRFINSMEYVSKLGWSIRGGLRNRTQMLFDWVKYGDFWNTKSKKFYNAENINKEMADRQLQRFGVMFGEKATAAGLATATAGSIEEVTPRGTMMTSEGGLKRVKETKLEKTTRGMATVAEKSAGPLQIAENANRKGTFRKAFALNFMAMSRNREYWKQKWMESHNTKEPPREEQLTSFIEFQAGNASIKAVRDLHFEYDAWAKAKVLQTTGGKVIGQFQTYRFALWDLQWQMLKDAKRGVQAGKYGMFETDAGGKVIGIMPEVAQAMRYLSLYAVTVPLISMVTNLDISNLVQNETYDTAQRFLEYYTADEDDPEQLEGKYGVFFGKGPIAGNLGPFISDLLTVADLFDVYDSTPEELQETMKMKYDPNDPDWWYKMARIANVQAARTGWHTIPSFLRDQYERMGRVETGLYKPKHMYDWVRKELFNSTDAAYKVRRNWLDNSPYSPQDWLYNGKILPKVEKKKKKRKNREAVSVLEGMLAGRY